VIGVTVLETITSPAIIGCARVLLWTSAPAWQTPMPAASAARVDTLQMLGLASL
jgi:hypothetical protein